MICGCRPQGTSSPAGVGRTAVLLGPSARSFPDGPTAGPAARGGSVSSQLASEAPSTSVLILDYVCHALGCRRSAGSAPEVSLVEGAHSVARAVVWWEEV